MADCPVLIVGAGPTGLVLALWLTRLGVRLRIIDKTAEPGTTSRALAVQARTLELYRQVGPGRRRWWTPASGPGGQPLGPGRQGRRLPLGDRRGLSPYPFALIYPQDDHERLLIDRLAALGVARRAADRVRLLRRSSRDGVRAVLRWPDGSEEVCEAAYLAGCDGAHSTVREALASAFPGGTYAGSSTSPTSRRRARRPTARSTSISTRPTSWPSSRSRGRAGCA